MKGNNQVKQLTIKPSSEDKKIPLQLLDVKFCAFKERAILVVLSNKSIFVILLKEFLKSIIKNI